MAAGGREAIQLYLAKYPKGKGLYSDLAELRLADLDRKAAPDASGKDSKPKLDVAILKVEEASKATEDALVLDAPGWRDLQSRLTGAGFSTGGIDGNVGDGTRRAIQSWQAARGYFVSGFLNKIQMAALLAEVPAVRAPPTQTVSRNVRPSSYSGSHQQNPVGGVGNFFNSVGQGIGQGIGAVVGCKLTRC